MSEIQNVQKVRKIVIFHQRDNLTQTIQTNATTWGELKEQSANDIDFNNIRGVVKSSKNTLDHVDAKLPEGDDLIYLFPTKIKSGMKTRFDYEQEYGSKKLRSMCSKRGLGTWGNKGNFAQRLADNDAKDDTDEIPVIKETITQAPVMNSPTSSFIETATVDSAIIDTTLKVRINNTSQLDGLLNKMFPDMKVVELDAIINITAKLELASYAPIDINTANQERLIKKTLVKELTFKEMQQEAEIINTNL